MTLVGWWVYVHHTSSGTLADGTVTIQTFVSHCAKSSKWSQTYSLMLQLQAPATTPTHNSLAGADPMAPREHKGARKPNTAVCLEIANHT